MNAKRIFRAGARAAVVGVGAATLLGCIPTAGAAGCNTPRVRTNTVQASCSNLEGPNWRARIKYWDATAGTWRWSTWQNDDGGMIVAARIGTVQRAEVVVAFDTDHPSY